MPVLFMEMADGKNVKTVCEEQGWPRPTVNLWAHSEKWRSKYLQAKEAQGAAQGERVLEMAEKAAAEKDWTKIQGLRVLVDALKWSAVKHNPRVYGERVDLQVTSRGPGVIALPEEEPVSVLARARKALGSSRVPNPNEAISPPDDEGVENGDA